MSQWDFCTAEFRQGRGSNKADRALCPKYRRERVIMMGAFLSIWVLTLVFRLYQLQLSGAYNLQQTAQRQQSGVVKIAAERGKILDRDGEILALSVPSGSVFVRPGAIEDRNLVAQKLSEVLELPAQTIHQKLEKESPFVWVKRQIPRVLAEEVRALEIAGVDFLIEPRRFYPYGSSASTLLGRVGVDGSGLSGLESKHESVLKAEAVVAPIAKDAFGTPIQLSVDARMSLSLPRGKDLQVTLSAPLQQILDQELARAFRETESDSVMAVLSDVDTGEILALSQAPSINFNSEKVQNRNQLKNLVLETVFEPGSILKPFVAAGLIENNVVSPHEMFDCQNGKLRFGRHTINDVTKNDLLSFHDVVVRSSNVGMTLAASRFSKNGLYEVLRAFGFGESSGLNLAGESGGILRPVSSWANIDLATHAYGQGLAVNPLQVVRALSAVVSDGVMPPLHLIRGEETPPAERVLSAKTAAEVRQMMIDVVSSEKGTGKRADIPGVIVGGKTGTAQKARTDGRGYEKGAYVVSFLGFADARRLGVQKRLALLVSIDHPRTEIRYGGVLAAPVFKRAMTKILLHLGAEIPYTTERDEPVQPELQVPTPEVQLVNAAYKHS